MDLYYRPPVNIRRHFNMSSNAPDDELYKKFNLIPSEELEYGPVCGHGSFGQVRIARWKGEIVATKSFHYKQNFHAEIKHFPQNKHPNIIKLFGICPHHSLLVLEFAEIGSLDNILHERLDVKYYLSHAINWCLQAARGVSYLHSIKPKPMMHRDLKPPNLLVFDEGRVIKLCDFGTLRMVDTEVTNQRGSAAWMAPEVFQTKSYSEKCDIYSWGIILWEILSRRKPYADITESCQIFWLVALGRRPPSLKDCPRDLESLMVSCWDRDPSKRPDIHTVEKTMQSLYDFYVDENDWFRTTTLQIPSDSPTCSQNSILSDVSSLSLPLEVDIRPDNGVGSHTSHNKLSSGEDNELAHYPDKPTSSRPTTGIAPQSSLIRTSKQLDTHDYKDTYYYLDDDDLVTLLSPDLIPTKPDDSNPTSTQLYELHREEAKSYVKNYFNIIVLEEKHNERIQRQRVESNGFCGSTFAKLKALLSSEKDKYSKMIEEEKISLKQAKESNQLRNYAMDEGWVVIN